ncbi:hypothetical protein GS474_23855 [Rhodococcus hoagii]|nr:hypothetical protein [Prescottella equi]
MVKYDIDGPYDYLIEGVYQHANELEQKGAGYEQIARNNRVIVAEHVTANQERDEPCVKCGESWPCGMIRGAINV